MNHRTKGMMAACALGMGASWNIANVGAVAEPVADHYGIGLAAVGLFTAILFLAELGSMAAVGPLAHRHGMKLLGLGSLGLCVGGNLLTLAVDGVVPALILRFVVGFGVGLAFVGGTMYVQQLGGGPLGQGLYGGLSLGAGGLALAVTPSLEGPLGWEAPFFSAAAAGILGAVVVAAGPDLRGPSAAKGFGFLKLLTDRRLLRFAAVQSSAFGLGIVLSNWVVTLLTRRGDYTPEAAGLIGALILVMGIIGRPGGGLYAHLRPTHVRSMLGVAMLLGAAGTFLVGLGPPPALAVFASLMIGVGAGVPFGPIVAGLGQVFPRSPGAAFGAMNTYALLMIALGTPLLGLSFKLPGDGLVGFVVAGCIWLLAALLLPQRELLEHSPADRKI